MPIQDKAGVRTAADLERKYNFAKMLGLTANVEANEKNLIKIETALNSMLESLIINLGDILGEQSDISLYFYEGIPSITNLPYISWTSPLDHIGDFYYDQLSGYVYQYMNNGWIQNLDKNLISALALTNVDLDVTTDHERKVYFATPSPPYSSGDWWVLNDGSLKICQLGKITGDTYDEQDFIVSSKYTTNIATKQGNQIKVLSGTITEFSENYVKYTDLSTGGSTTIAGNNVTTGQIKSKNYVAGLSGAKIDLENGNVDMAGDINLGGYIKSSKGMVANFPFPSDLTKLGHDYISSEGGYYKKGILKIPVVIPENFEIINAKITVYIYNTENYSVDSNQNEISRYGKVQHIKLYKDGSPSFVISQWGDVHSSSSSQPEIAGAFGTDGYTTTTEANCHFTSIDIKSSLAIGDNIFEIRTSDADLNATLDADIITALSQTQMAFAILNISGYLKIA